MPFNHGDVLWMLGVGHDLQKVLITRPSTHTKATARRVRSAEFVDFDAPVIAVVRQRRPPAKGVANGIPQYRLFRLRYAALHERTLC